MAGLAAALIAGSIAVASAGIPPVGSTVGTFTAAQIEVPNTDAWPGATDALSNAAFPSGRQPPRLRYWPQLNFGDPKRTLLGCWKSTVLHDTASGWPGLCVNLAKNPEISTLQGCKTFCEQESRCPVWQFNNQTTPGQCWVGYGTKCASRIGRNYNDIHVEASQRIMHGDVLVLKNLAGWKVNNLYMLGKFEAGTEELGVERCKAWCYSTVGCQYWQYSSVAGGCFVDAPMFSTDRNSHPQNVVQYPLTTNGGAHQDSTFTAGEFIVHYCPPQVATPVAPTAAPQVQSFGGGGSQAAKEEGGGGFFGTWVIGGFLFLIAAGGVYMYSQGGAKGKKSSKRNVNASRDGGDSDTYDRSSYGGYEDDLKPLMKTPQTPDPYARQNQNPYGQPPPPPGQGNSFQQMPPTTYGPGPGRGGPPMSGRGGQPGGMMPPPTQLVDFGQTPGMNNGRPGPSSMAPTQLMNQGMPFPSPGQQRGY